MYIRPTTLSNRITFMACKPSPLLADFISYSEAEEECHQDVKGWLGRHAKSCITDRMLTTLGFSLMRDYAVSRAEDLPAVQGRLVIVVKASSQYQFRIGYITRVVVPRQGMRCQRVWIDFLDGDRLIRPIASSAVLEITEETATALGEHLGDGFGGLQVTECCRGDPRATKMRLQFRGPETDCCHEFMTVA